MGMPLLLGSSADQGAAISTCLPSPSSITIVFERCMTSFFPCLLTCYCFRPGRGPETKPFARPGVSRAVLTRHNGDDLRDASCSTRPRRRVHSSKIPSMCSSPPWRWLRSKLTLRENASGALVNANQSTQLQPLPTAVRSRQRRVIRVAGALAMKLTF